MTLRERELGEFWKRVAIGPDCWEWTGYCADTGYGRFIGAAGTKNYALAHRYSFEFFFGAIPRGCHVHHNCKNRSCVRPDHLSVVTPREHMMLDDGIMGAFARQTHCVHGHEFNVENTGYDKRGCRYCKQCNRDNANRWYARTGRDRYRERMQGRDNAKNTA